MEVYSEQFATDAASVARTVSDLVQPVGVQEGFMETLQRDLSPPSPGGVAMTQAGKDRQVSNSLESDGVGTSPPLGRGGGGGKKSASFVSSSERDCRFKASLSKRNTGRKNRLIGGETSFPIGESPRSTLDPISLTPGGASIADDLVLSSRWSSHPPPTSCPSSSSRLPLGCGSRGSWRGWGRWLFVAWATACIVTVLMPRGAGATPRNQAAPDCCRMASGSCRTTCHQTSLVQFAMGSAEARRASMEQLLGFCPPHLESFWSCMNETLRAISEGEGWWGRACCDLPLSHGCQLRCLQATSRQDLRHVCRASHEIDFFTCVERMKVGAECCSKSQSHRCRSSCEAVFAAQGSVPRTLRHRVKEECVVSPAVRRCVHNHTKVTPAHRPERNLHCCGESLDSDCRSRCRTILTTRRTQQDIVEALEGACGRVDLLNKVWICMLRHSEAIAPATRQVSQIDQMGMDSAKLHCCFRASSEMCRNLCFKTFSREWTKAWDDLDRVCLSKLSQTSLVQCIKEVDEPCELGCHGLSFCSHFNNRPGQLYRACTARADRAAESDFENWTANNNLALPDLTIPVRSISECQPEMWRAVACTLQVKPCHPATHSNRICRSDCYQLLSQCLDFERLPPGLSAGSLCELLSPDPDSPCVSVQPYLSPASGPYVHPKHQVTMPCRSSPCVPSEVCEVNRNCRLGQACYPHLCTPGCRLGEVSHITVPVGSYVSIPISNNRKGCQKICRCGVDGSFDECLSVPCVELTPCWVGSNKIDHDTQFVLGCNSCTCYAGEVTCTQKACSSSFGVALPPGMQLGRGVTTGSSSRAPYTSLPCGCPHHFVPVCASSGRTFASECLAMCSGLGPQDWVAGECGEDDHCATGPCLETEGCVNEPRTCLASAPCPQYTCVPLTGTCPLELSRPACDVTGRDHVTMCALVRAGARFAYAGYCVRNCKRRGKVCGQDGRTWVSECQAKAQHVAVDYRGPCRAVGDIEAMPKPACKHVQCAPLVLEGCIGSVPAGSCCPVCGGALRLLYSQDLVDRALVTLKHTSPLTVTTLVKALRREVRVAECDLTGHITVEGDLFILVFPLTEEPSNVQLEACIKEAEKIETLVQQQNPRLMSQLPLSALTLAIAAHTSGQSPRHVPWATLLPLSMLPLLWSLWWVSYCLVAPHLRWTW
ncbi:reversion-inducing-cysteine-rich protein with kazal motifs [Oratosquilla oratoria]|uniref:reversion-inducing-cysteine-rich protein with kazal motifs n=1 Tax=Oratosquilla oratoria TaxID=337810 RepID=UPI003F76DA69